MDLRQLEYIVAIAKEKNITHAAEKVYISQSALNQQLLKLEKDLGAELFHRNRKNWELTEIGKIYVENAKKILEIKRETYKQIEDRLELKSSKIVIGISRGRWIELFTYIFLHMQEKFPNLQLEPIELSVQEQENRLVQGEIDMGIMTLEEEQRKSNNYIELFKEKFVLILPKKHRYVEIFEKIEKVAISMLIDEKLIILNKKSTAREIVDRVFEKAGLQPRILFETSSMNSIVSAVIAGVGCGIVPYYYAYKNRDKLNYFDIEGMPTWDIVISYRKGSYLTQGMKEIIKCSREFYKNYI